MKARDLLDKNMDAENDSEEPRSEGKQEDDAVAAAYENISKKLESIRNGKSGDDEEDSESQGDKGAESEEPELEEWKGPKPPAKKDEPEEEEHELKKVDLKSLEDDRDEIKRQSDKETEDEIDPLDDEGDEKESGDKEDEKEVKEWEPKENDPLDDEDEEEEKDEDEDKAMHDKEDDDKMSEASALSEDMDKQSLRSEDLKDEEDRKPVRKEDDESDLDSVHSEVRARPDVSEPSDMPEDATEEKAGPDTLDDLADESPFARKNDEEDMPKKQEDELPLGEAASSAYNRDPQEEDEYSIPNLKGSRQEGGDMGYNAHPQRESVGQSYSPKGSYMEGNDPNNFFSNHPPQPPKRANKFHLLVLIIIGIAVIGFTVYILKGGFGGINLGTSQPSPSPSATATPESTPTPTPEPEVERGNFTVRVLNGTSTSGLAKTVSDKLKETGYKTAAPGNAEDSDVEQTEIRVKEGTESAQLFERLKLDLAPDYDAKEGEKLDEKSKNDAEVIIGAK